MANGITVEELVDIGDTLEDIAEDIDSTTNDGATLTESEADKATHDGYHFKAGYQDTSITTSEKFEILYVVPDTDTVFHWSLVAQCTGACTIEVYEGTTVTETESVPNYGTEITPSNRNRNSNITATIAVYHTPTIATDGTKWSEKWIGSTGFRTDIAGEHTTEHEILLMKNTNYLIRATSNAETIKISAGADWFEIVNED